MAKRESKTEITTTVAEEVILTTPVLQFKDSTRIEGAIQGVILQPIGWGNVNGKFLETGGYNSQAALKAMQEYLGEVIIRKSENVHVPSSKYSKRSLSEKIYVGGGLVLAAADAGERSITVEGIRVSIPTAEDRGLFGNWTQVYLTTPYSGRAVPATDGKHVANIERKHFYLNELFNGVKLVAWTDPDFFKGELWSGGSEDAKRFREAALASDGSINPAAVIASAYFAKKQDYSDNRSAEGEAKVTKRLVDNGLVAAVSVISVNGVPVSVQDVEPGFYKVLRADGSIKYSKYCLFGNMVGYNSLISFATNKESMISIDLS